MGLSTEKLNAGNVYLLLQKVQCRAVQCGVEHCTVPNITGHCPVLNSMFHIYRWNIIKYDLC